MPRYDTGTTPNTTAGAVFDRRLVRARRNRAAAAFLSHDFLIAEIAARLAERVGEVNRRFTHVLDLGAHRGELSKLLDALPTVENIYTADHAVNMAKHLGPRTLVCDEEMLPFADHSLNLVVSNLVLHLVNDLPGCLIQIRRALAPDGLFLGALFGGDTLWELRASLLAAEATLEGGSSPRVAPFAATRDAGDLLHRAGFALAVADVDTITVTYPDMFALMRDLRGMGQSNSLLKRRKSTMRRATLMAAAEHYQEHFASSAGRITASFQIIYLLGWAPHASQPKPLAPGSARTALADALATHEHKSEPIARDPLKDD